MREQERNFDYMVRAHFLEEMKYYKHVSNSFHATAPQRHRESEQKRIERAM
jgi:hypothetical protein